MILNFLKKSEKVNKEVERKSYLNVTDEEIARYSEGLNNDLRVMHFTHTDISGKVCSLLGKRTFNNIETLYCSNNKVDDIINEFILVDKKYNEFDIILITDVSLGEGAMTNIENMLKFSNSKVKVLYINHQETNLKYTDEYKWAYIEPMFNEIKQDSASIMYRYMILNYNLKSDLWLNELVEKSRRYTKWEWIELKDETANHLSMLCHNTNHDYFVRKLIQKHISLSSLLEEDDINNIRFLEEKYEEYKEKKITETILSRMGKVNVGFVYAEQYINEIAEDILNHFKKLDLIVIINSMARINIRSARHSVVDANQLAYVFNGKGEKFAAGASIPIEIREKMIDDFISNYQED